MLRKLRRLSPEVILAHLCAVLSGIAITWGSAAIGLGALFTHTCIGSFDCPAPRFRTARQHVREIEAGVAQYSIDNNRCPTSSDALIAGRFVSARSAIDPWGKAIFFSCAGEDVKVVSAGADRTFGTADDVTNER